MGWITRGISVSRAPFRDFKSLNAEDTVDTEETEDM